MCHIINKIILNSVQLFLPENDYNSNNKNAKCKQDYSY